ncbi:MAG: ATP-binding protein [Pseudomonadota bacterium]
MNNKIVNYEAIFDQMPVVRFVIEQRKDRFFVIAANDLAIQFFDRDEDGVIDHSIDDLFNPANAKRMSDSFAACIEKKSPVTIPSLPSFPGHMRVPGFWVNPIYDKNDDLMWLDVIGQPNVTDSSIVERERDDALLLLTSIFDASEVGILVFDRHRRIVKMNDSFERIFGWNRKDVLGKDFINFITEDEHEIANENYETFVKTGQRANGEVKIICKDGAIANTLYTTVSMELSHGRRFQVTTLVDITKQKQMQFSLKFAKEQADSANNAKSAFLANMSHELRTPLNAIIGFSEMMMNETFGPLGHEKYTEYNADVLLSARHLLEIINEVLDMSKIEAGRVELSEQEVDLKMLAGSVVRMVTSRVLDSNIKVEFDCLKNLARLQSDPRLIRQILINILTNAVKYSHKDGKVYLRIKTDKQKRITIEIEDEGVGIPTDRLNEAMEPFGQIHEPDKSSIYQGTGLGLPLAKAMVELHNGEIKLHSEEGKGTKVTVIFPKERTIS